MALDTDADVEASYRHFLQRICETGKVWLLVDQNHSEAVADSHDMENTDGTPVPVHLLFSDSANARQLATDEWKHFRPVAIPLSHLLDSMIPKLQDSGDLVGPDIGADLAGFELEPTRLAADILEMQAS